jgi:hypothetical protein
MSNDDATADDLDDGGDDEPELRGNPAVYARNWRTVLAVDAGMGVLVIVAGVIAAVAWNLVLGGVLGSLGVAYVALVVRRGREWSALRREAGLGR